MGNHAESRTIKLDHIKLTNECQQRETIDDNVVQKYAALLSSGIRLPSLRIIHDGSEYFLWDGYHTFHALKIAGFTKYHCEITEGDFRRAVFLACSSRRTHGIERTPEDIHRQIDTLLRDPQYRAMSIRTLGRHVGVSHTSIRRRRDHWQMMQEINAQQQHWAVNGTEPTTEETVIVNEPLLPTALIPDRIKDTNNRRDTRQQLRWLNRQAWKRFSAANKTLAQAITHLTKIKHLRPSRDINKMLKKVGAITTELAKLRTDSESLSGRLS